MGEAINLVNNFKVEKETKKLKIIDIICDIITIGCDIL